MAGRRAARVAERIREEASEIILYELQDPRIRFVTVTKVDVSPDLRYATVYVSALGGAGQQRAVLRGLDSARGLIQRRIGRSLGLRETPILRFRFDPSIERSIEMSRILDQVARELAEHDAERAEQAEDEPSDDEPPGEEPPGGTDAPPAQDV